MIRSLIILMLVLGAGLAGLPNVTPTHHGPFHAVSNTPSLTIGDPNRTLTAFNYTYGQADLYTRSSPGLKFNQPPNSTVYPYNFTTFTWLRTEPRTTNATLVAGSAFRFNLTKTNLPLSNTTRFLQLVSWNLTIPKFNCGNCYSTSINFTFFGDLTKGTSANYTIATNTGTIVKSENFTGAGSAGVFFPATKIASCLGRCFNATKYIGSFLTITFRLGWNSSETGMTVDVGEMVVGSQDLTLKNSVSNYMTLSSGVVTHLARFSGVNFNSTVPGHVWSNQVLNVYYPAGYNVTQIMLQNSTLQTVYRVPGRSAFEAENCFDLPACTISLVALNMSDLAPSRPLFVKNGNITLVATTPNTVTKTNTLASSVPTNEFLPSDILTVQVVNKPAVANLTNSPNPSLNITFTDPTGSQTTILPKRLQTATGGNYTATIPSGPFGIWSITVAFINNYDMGFASRTFTLEEIQVSPSTFSYSGSNTALATQGTLIYATSNSTTPPASNLNGVLFAVDTGTPTTNPITTITTNPSSTSLYIANVTLVNGVFGQTPTLVVTFTIINPTSSSLFSANVTIEHEWTSSQTHGVSLTIPLVLGDQPFSTQVSKRYPYEADISFASSPIQVKLTSLTTLNSKTVTLSQGSDPIVPGRQHTGLFKITVNSAILGSSAWTPSSLESPPYAYVPGLPSLSGRYLAYALFTTRTDGSFSITTSSNAILGAKKLVLFALARDAKGVPLVNGQNPGPTDSTILQASLDPINQLTVGQTVQPMLHLTSNASKITEIITVTETLQGSGVVDSHTVTIQPGASQPVTFTLTAPQTTGSYTVTFSSPQYGGPFASQTVQVSSVSSNLQLLIPAAIGLVAAIIVLGFYLVRRTPEKDTAEADQKPKPTGPKPKTQPGSGSSTSKSLTQTRPRF